MPFEQQGAASGRGNEALFSRMHDLHYEMVQDFRAGKAMSWPVLEPSVVHKVWERFAQTGNVPDEQALQRILESIRDNVARLSVATIVAGHEGVSAQDVFDYALEDEEFEAFVAWLIETPQGWRISDYGVGPLWQAVALAIDAKTLPARLKYLDRALHVMHMRSDLAALFIRGGRPSVEALDEIDTLASCA